MLFKYRSSVIPLVLPSTLLVTVIAAVITILYELTNVKLSIDQTFINVIGIVISLLLSYRITVSYERYWDCRSGWITMSSSIRIMSMLIWVNVDDDIINKKTALNWLLAFAIAAKHHVREESGQFADLEPLISNIKNINFNHPEFDDFIIKRNILCIKKARPNLRQKNHIEKNDVPLPVVISSNLFAYFRKISEDKKKANEYTLNILHENLVQMIDCFSKVEKTISEPLVYSIHMSQTIWIYCLALPFQLVANSGWIAIPIVFFMAFILFGAHKIGLEVEKPWGYSNDDLDLDSLCRLIQMEMHSITKNPPATFEDVVYPENLPDKLGISEKESDTSVNISDE